ncbi:MAG: radical SAM protein [Nanoarchaeota archaeon]|nr:radical SAM protein [Nanoarchaeota archaeon]
MKLIRKFNAIIKVLSAKYLGRKALLCVDFRITTRCNNNCLYCNVPAMKTDEMTTRQIFKMIDEAYELGCIYFDISGGEPLLREDIGEIINYAKNRGLLVGLVTNGKLVAQKLGVLKNLDTIAVSLDGPVDVHDKLRGKGSFQAAVDAIDLLQKNGMKVLLFTVLTEYNIDKVDYILNFAEEHKVMLHFNKIFEHRSYTPDVGEMVPKHNDFVDAVKLIKDSRSRQVIDSHHYLDYLIGKGTLPKCYAGQLFCRIDPNGDVYPCQDLLGKFMAKNLCEVGLKEAFRNMKRDKLCNDCNCALYLELNYLFAGVPFNISEVTDRVRRLKQ